MEHAHAVRARRARPDDAPALVPLLQELLARGEGRAESVAAAVVAAGPAGREAWVLPGQGGPLLGLLALAPSSQPAFRVGFVDWIAVAPAARRQGLGLRLLALARRRARALGWRQLHAYTFHTNRAALHLYVEAGFYPAATLPDYAGPGVHYVEMVWPVPAGGRRGVRR